MQGAAFRELRSESSQTMETPCLDPVQHVPQFRVTVCGSDKHSVQRARSAMDAWLGGCIELELSTRIGLFYESPNYRAVGGRGFGPLWSSSERRLNDGFEQPCLAAKRPIDRLDDDSGLGGDCRH